jgi:WD40 repeat protein
MNPRAGRWRGLIPWAGIACAWLALSCPLSAQGPGPRAVLRGHAKAVTAVAVSPDGKALASGSGDTLKLWDLGAGRVASTLETSGVTSLAFSPDGKSLASGHRGNTIRLWDLASGKGTTLLAEPHQYAQTLVAFSPDGKTLASGGRCIPEVSLWDVASGRATATLRGPATLRDYDEYGVSGLAFSPDGRALASRACDGGVKLWDVASGRTTATCDRDMVVKRLKEGEPFRDCTVAFSPDGKAVASASGAGTVKVWEAATGLERAAFEGHSGEVRAVAFSPDGRTLASGGGREVRLWDLQAGKLLAALGGHGDEVLCVAFSPDGKTLASGGRDSTVRLWDVGPGR